MPNIPKSVEDKVTRRDRLKRRMRLMRLLSEIAGGGINSSKTPRYNILNQRAGYVSPEDRSGHNYGYMESGEMNYPGEGYNSSRE